MSNNKPWKQWRLKHADKRNAWRRGNYARGDFGHRTRRLWSQDEDRRVIAHTIPDRELAQDLGRSVQAIQVRRCKLKKDVA